MIKEPTESSTGQDEDDTILFKEDEESEPRDPKEKRFEVGAKTVAGPYRENEAENEDRILIDEEEGVFAVFDEAGRHSMGGQAADWFASYVKKHSKELSPSSFKEAIEAVENILIKASGEFVMSGGTTASLVKIWEEGEKDKKAEEKGKREKIGIVANSADSRVYVKRSNSKLEQVTVDDGPLRLSEERTYPIFRQGKEEEIKITAETLKLINTEKKIRKLQKKFNNCQQESELSDEEKKLFKLRNMVTNLLGRSYQVKPGIYIIRDFSEGDRILLVSDGVSDNLTDNEIDKILDEQKIEQEAAEKLIESAKERSQDAEHFRAKPDDMSAIIVGLPR